MSRIAYIRRIQGIVLRHRDLTLRMDRRLSGRALMKALRGNALAMAEGDRVVDEESLPYLLAHAAIHGPGAPDR